MKKLIIYTAGGPGAIRNSTANSASSVDHAHTHDTNTTGLEQKKDEETSNKTIFLQTAEWLLNMKAIKVRIYYSIILPPIERLLKGDGVATTN